MTDIIWEYVEYPATEEEPASFYLVRDGMIVADIVTRNSDDAYDLVVRLNEWEEFKKTQDKKQACPNCGW